MGRKHVLMLLAASFCFMSAIHAFAAGSPYIFYSDLTSGPNSGGLNGLGAIVTVYGTGFGSSQSKSYVTVGGRAAASYLSWSDSRIAFQPGPYSSSGRIVVHAGGSASNGIGFNVRSGSIRFVAVSGTDAGNGRYSNPWKTLTRALRSLSPGDIVYVMDGVQQVTPDSNGSALSIATGGWSSSPIALIAYPKANVQIGSATGTNYGIYASSAANWVISGIQIRGSGEAVHLNRSSGWRIVGNDISCPNASGTGACVDATRSGSARVLGNIIHESGTRGSALPNFDALLFNYGNGITVAWNEIAGTNGCRAFHLVNPNSSQNIAVHDNWIHDSVCDGISLDNVDPSGAPVAIYNNVIARAGTGPYPGDGSSFTCLSVGGSGSGSVEVVNNTLHDCGAQGGASAGALAASTPANLQDTIVDVTSAESYLANGSDASQWSGSNNLFNGGSSAPTVFTASVIGDPQFVDPAHDNYQLQNISPAVDAGVDTSITRDFLGVVRPQNVAFDIGAFEFVGAPGSVPSQGQLQATPASVSFGSVNVGSTSAQDITVLNTGTVAVNISQAGVSGAGFSMPQPLASVSLAPGASTSLHVVFSPTAVLSYAGTVTIASNASNSPLLIPLAGTGTQAPQAQLTATPTALAFGNVNTGASKTLPLTITNSGTASASITQIGATGTGFSIGPITTPYLLAAGSVMTVQVTFSPSSVTAYNAGLSIVSDAPNSPLNVSLSGTGTQPPQAQLTSTPTSVAFGNVNTGATSTQTVTLKNTGNATATISQVSATGTGFTVSPIVTPYPLAAGATLAVQVVFAPTSATAYNGGLNVVSDAPNSPTAVPLTGTGTQPPQAQLTVTPTSVAFGGVNTGSTSTQALTIKNTGNAVANITQVGISGTGFTASGLVTPYALAAGATLTIQVTFAPTAVTTYSGALSVASDAPNSPLTVPLSGTGTQPPQALLTATPTSVAFGNVTVGTSSTQVVAVKNTGNASATIGQISSTSAAFTTSGLATPYVLAAGATVSLQVTFSPASAIAYSGNLSIASNAANASLGVPVSGTGTQAPQGQITVTPASLNFGNVTVGSTATNNITVKNTGNASATISQIGINGSGFTASGITLPYMLAAGASASFQIQFSPNAAGTFSATAVLSSSAANSSLSIPLTGTGTAVVPQHSVDLNWTDSDTTVTSYNVYRATQTGGPYTKANASAIVSTIWTDASVQAGQTYYYVVTAVNSSGAESAYSAEAKAVIPTP